MKSGVNRLDGIRKFKYVIISVFVVAVAFNLFMIFFFHESTFAGFDISAVGQIIFGIQGNPVIHIIEPKNITYNFSLGTYPMDLNITANFDIGDYDLYYRLYDAKHDAWATNWVSFSSFNETFNAVRWQNIIHVNATDGTFETSENVSFYVNVSNHRPVIYNVISPIYVCESGQLIYPYYVIDVEEDMNPTPNGEIVSSLSRTYSKFFSTSSGRLLTRYNYLLYSTMGALTKGNSPSDVISLNEGSRNFSTDVQAFDGEYTDNVSTNITVLEINNKPVLEDIIVQTKIWNQGENSTFYKVVGVSDVEYDMTPRWGALDFNVSIKNSTGDSVNLFGITFNGTNGIINFTADSSVDVGVYDVRICVNDTGITKPDTNLISVCGQDGGSQTACDDFSLTITNENRPPSIIEHYPTDLNFSANGRSTVYFNITTYDPDGTIPDVYWFVNNVSMKYDFGKNVSKFNVTLPCGFSGNYYVRPEITDGLLNDSITWVINVSYVACPSGDIGGGGGGGGGGGSLSPACGPRWVCNPWMVCQNTAASLDSGILSGLNYREIQDKCDEQSLDEHYCGFQIRGCIDLNVCNVTRDKPEELQSCIYSENPSCSDGIRNCHDDSCELLVDCGGPCGACASCSDKIRNQGEQGVDCGGPCPWQCKASIPLLKKKGVLLGLLIALLLLIIFIIYKLIRVLQYKRKIGEQKVERGI